ncbi:40S ribosomal protein S25 [Cavenderia fasciculata]|uniref:40S ribosomal protein S25 n=1 Tax=Cavenderia fasciculata TaxID=261658 RepID=F4QET7_CACFS|nr:40S ribosomal protein S25 [Cavenderia fasciculata]EGG14144.1 40S ribosomal protein S25 [Cavenderia fasciculata]|eukprot:XP_004350852.1 40S ribosomal protein S25 [Cavenderia fasciculata]
MPPKVGGKSKQIQAAKSAAGNQKGARKKWSKGKSKEKLANLVLLDKETFNKVNKELPGQKVITIANVSDKYKVNGSLARRIIRDFAAKGQIKKVIYSHRSGIFTKV